MIIGNYNDLLLTKRISSWYLSQRFTLGFISVIVITKVLLKAKCS